MPIKPWQADLLLLLVAAVWGTTFVIVKSALDQVPPFTFLALRFTLAAMALFLLFPRHIRGSGRQALAPGLLIGLFLFSAYAFQTFGLLYTGAAKAGFITGLLVVIVPVAQAVLWRQLPRPAVTAGVILAAVGLLLVTGPFETDGLVWLGDLLILLCAFAFAGHILSVAVHSRRAGAAALAVWQISFVAGASWTAALIFEQPFRVLALPAAGLGELAAALGVTGIIATAGAYLVQSSVQRYTSATHTALIFTTEPVFAYLFAWWWAGEVLSAMALAGSMMILAGMILAEVRRQQHHQLMPDAG